MPKKPRPAQLPANVERSTLNVQRSTSSAGSHALAQSLINWFLANARDLPWRRTLDPYAIWISEIMLQQTQVKTVIPYYERWLRELPTIEALARADTDRVLKLWEGLGYYTRARNLQKAAQQVVNGHAGQFPRNFDAVLALPGIGRYTAGAICSIAFNQPTPILDGNVIRVITRLFAIRGNPRDKRTNDELWHQAEQLVQVTAAPNPKLKTQNSKLRLSGPCSALNQSLMELGATICLPRAPRCGDCPVSNRCVARKKNLVDRLPNLGPRAQPTARRFHAFVVERRGHVLLRQRPAGVVNAHLWEFPNLEASDATRPVGDHVRALLGRTAAHTDPLCTIKHSITRYRITVEASHVQLTGASNGTPAGCRWVRVEELDNLAFTSAHRRILRAFLARREDGSRQGARAPGAD